MNILLLGTVTGRKHKENGHCTTQLYGICTRFFCTSEFSSYFVLMWDKLKMGKILRYLVSVVLFFTSYQSCSVNADPNEGRCAVSGTPLHCKNSVPCVLPIPPSAVAASSVHSFSLLFSERQKMCSMAPMTSACASWLASCCWKRRGLKFACLFLTLSVELLSSIQRLMFMDKQELSVKCG